MYMYTYIYIYIYIGRERLIKLHRHAAVDVSAIPNIPNMHCIYMHMLTNKIILGIVSVTGLDESSRQHAAAISNGFLFRVYLCFRN